MKEVGKGKGKNSRIENEERTVRERISPSVYMYVLAGKQSYSLFQTGEKAAYVVRWEVEGGGSQR